jgi:hypothetical protein
MMKLTRLFVGVLAVFVGVVSTAAAGTDWLQKGKDLLHGATKSDVAAPDLSVEEITAGLKDALLVGSEKVVTQLGQQDGFSADPAVRIPLPDSLDTVRSALDKIGMASLLSDLELRLNRAAEAAMPPARQLFVEAIEGMTMDDVKAIYQGPDDAATRYFQAKMSQPLAEEMTPIVNSSLADVGAVQAYDQVMSQYRSIPFMPEAQADLSDHVVTRALDGIFYYLAQQEAAIRQDPAKRTTEILKRVFGAS